MLPGEDTAGFIGESQYQLIQRMELTESQHNELKRHVEEKGMCFLSTPFSREAADLLQAVGVDAYKVGSGELTNLPLLTHIGSKGKPMIVSTGMSDFSEVDTAVALLKEQGVEFGLMQCTSMYPTPPEEAHLLVIQRYIREFDVPVGYSDHSADNYLALAAVALGACMVEKHFTISRQWPGPDQASSIEPNQLADLVRGIRCVEQSIDENKRPTGVEEELQQLFRESVVSLSDIPAGSTITEDMVWVKRPGKGIPAHKLNEVIGAKAANDIVANAAIGWDDLSS